ncbi:MAG: Nif3-like dinuclear metal center hexameric protein [Ottowia sp.]|nr:Nif3-like dinuclear metal center hexameric protein [Ottowia sp.]
METRELELYLNDLLSVSRFDDYCPNGLQVQGHKETFHLVTGVTASLALIEQAVALGADAILVHHGYFWKGEDACVTGQKYLRLKQLLQNNINLFAYHLPLDAHPELGNNTQLGELLGLNIDNRFGNAQIACIGTCSPQTLTAMCNHISKQLGRTPLLIGDGQRVVSRIAWCSGAAQSWLNEAVKLNADVYISGEISESTVHLARESGTAYIAAGHHATERGGVMALGEHLAHRFGLTHHFIDIPNPA